MEEACLCVLSLRFSELRSKPFRAASCRPLVTQNVSSPVCLWRVRLSWSSAESEQRLGYELVDNGLVWEAQWKECSLNLAPLKIQGSLDTRFAHNSSMWCSRAWSVCLLNLGEEYYNLFWWRHFHACKLLNWSQWIQRKACSVFYNHVYNKYVNSEKSLKCQYYQSDCDWNACGMLTHFFPISTSQRTKVFFGCVVYGPTFQRAQPGLVTAAAPARLHSPTAGTLQGPSSLTVNWLEGFSSRIQFWEVTAGAVLLKNIQKYTMPFVINML